MARVHLDDVRLALAVEAAEAPNGAEVQFAAQGHLVNGESRVARAFSEGRPRGADDLGDVAAIAQSGGEEERLSLPAAPGALGVDVESHERAIVHRAPDPFFSATTSS